jgi:hypothetical protein
MSLAAFRQILRFASKWIEGFATTHAATPHDITVAVVGEATPAMDAIAFTRIVDWRTIHERDLFWIQIAVANPQIILRSAMPTKSFHSSVLV